MIIHITELAQIFSDALEVVVDNENADDRLRSIASNHMGNIEWIARQFADSDIWVEIDDESTGTP